jgi:general stress protein 26
MTDNDDMTTIRTILGSERTAIVTTRSGNALHSRPLAIQGADEFDGTLWFFTPEPSPKTVDIEKSPEVNIAVGGSKGYLSLSGTARVSRDQAIIDKFWNPWAEAWFDGGRDDPAVALLEVTVDSVEYWDLDKPKIARALEVVRAIVTKTPPEVGDSKTVAL